jgi:hypothetical protein
MLKAFRILSPLIGLAALLSAQTTEAPDTFKVTYFSNANSPDFRDGMVRITNVGTQVGSPSHALGYLCAMIYVSDPDQQLHECCGCQMPPDSLRTLSINANLTSNPLTPVVITNGDIKSSLPSELPFATRPNRCRPLAFAPGRLTSKTKG